ncbi:hypothetical protein HW555_012336 [Spodoptera exigua]|uniref:ATP-dependent DNA helicase n=1 Tax=Spodoptera exigua TaxID=7107 RepID=A0A835L0T9_SPOEX|nr:hypothetical protein HW555_012336 [Spodoptera exigua]
MLKFIGIRGGCVVRCKDYAYATWSKAKAMKEKKKKAEEGSGGVAELNPWPEYIQKRITLWDKFKIQYEEELAKKPDVSIVVTLPDGKTVEAKAWKTTPYDVAKGISQGLADSTIIARVNNELWDLDRPLEGDCKLELLRWDNTDAQAVFWHSSAHMLGEAMERVYGGCLCYGPPIEEGFYYDMYYPEKGGRNETLRPLTGERLQRERQKWRHINWLIIDEISMVPYLTLRNIHIRLQQLKQDQGNFGGINVILFGDLMQLPPVSRITGGSYCFRQPSNLTGETNLWQLFSFCEWPQNMRQAGDNTFVDILNNIRVGELTMDQLEILDSRRIPLEGPFADGEAVRIFPTTKQVDAYNSAMTKKLGKSLKLYQINAVDISLEAKTYGKCPRKQYISDDPNKTGGILGTLTIGIGSRVMLRRNINVNHGLVNGAMGIIRRIEWPSLRREQLEPGELPQAVFVEFDDRSVKGNELGVGVRIEPSTVDFDALRGQGKIERRMLPLILCWAISSTDFHVLEGLVKKIAKEKQPFERLELTKEQLLEMFDYNPFKVRILNEKVNTPTTTVYRCGPLIDLCRGPHVRHTGKVKALKVTKEQELFFFHELSPGSCFFQPRGAHIYNTLVNFIREQYRYASAKHINKNDGVVVYAKSDIALLVEEPEFNSSASGLLLKIVYSIEDPNTAIDTFISLVSGAIAANTVVCRSSARKRILKPWITPGLLRCIRNKDILHRQSNQSPDNPTLSVTYKRIRGFQEVVSPNMFNAKLWQTSGHWAHYSENMFSFDVEKETFALKPMNCPGHCLMFDNRIRSWRELPLRLADFGVLHRNELSGALTGLTRLSCLDFLNHVYSTFGFTFQLKLSTRPEKYLGELATWDQAEKALEDSLNKFGRPWQLNPGDGAFYGPKIDITIQDAESGEKKRPVIIHRAILGSVERMIAILSESYAGKWPFWLSPRQVCVVPVGPSFDDYAVQVNEKLFAAGFMSEVDTDAGDTLNKKVRNAQLAQFNYILVVGDREKQSGTVNVRTRDNKVHGEMSVQGLIDHLNKLVKEKTLAEDSDLLN